MHKYNKKKGMIRFFHAEVMCLTSLLPWKLNSTSHSAASDKDWSGPGNEVIYCLFDVGYQ